MREMSKHTLPNNYTALIDGNTVYQPYVEEMPLYRPAPRKEAQWNDYVRRRKLEAARLKQQRQAKLRKVCIAVEITLLAIVVLVTSVYIVMRYERIAATNTEISTLKDEISVLEEQVNAMSAKVECAVDIASVKNAVTDMNYPANGQIIRAGFGVGGAAYTNNTPDTAP